MINKICTIIMGLIVSVQFPLDIEANNTLKFNTFLTDSNDMPLNKAVKIKFCIFNLKNEMKWFRERFLTINKGNLDIILGRVVPLDDSFFDGEHYIGLSVFNNIQYEKVFIRHKLLFNKQASLIDIVECNKIRFNSYLINSKGKPINKTLKAIFSIYDKTNRIQWSRERYIRVNEGKIDILLGRTVQIENNLFDGEHYLGLLLINNFIDEYIRIRQKIKVKKQLQSKFFCEEIVNNSYYYKYNVPMNWMKGKIFYSISSNLTNMNTVSLGKNNIQKVCDTINNSDDNTLSKNANKIKCLSSITRSNNISATNSVHSHQSTSADNIIDIFNKNSRFLTNGYNETIK